MIYHKNYCRFAGDVKEGIIQLTIIFKNIMEVEVKKEFL